MRAYRIVKRKRALEAFTGAGARAYGGRWNRVGIPMVYAAQTRALAALESLAHFGGAERRIEFVLYAMDIPDDLVLAIDAAALPGNWRSAEPQPFTQDLGSTWQAEGRSAALRVPSVLIPEEHCVLLNPEHTDTRQIQVEFPVPFEFDGRL